MRWDLEDPISSGCLSPLLTHLFYEHSHRVFGVLFYAISESCDTDFAGQVVFKPWVLSVSSEALMPITAILIPEANCVLLLHRLVIGPVTVHLMLWFLNANIILNVSQTGCTVASQLGFKSGVCWFGKPFFYPLSQADWQ